MNDNSFDNLIKQMANGHEAHVPAGTWEAISQKKKKRRLFPVFWWFTGMGAMVAGIIGGGSYLNSSAPPASGNNGNAHKERVATNPVNVSSGITSLSAEPLLKKDSLNTRSLNAYYTDARKQDLSKADRSAVSDNNNAADIYKKHKGTDGINDDSLAVDDAVAEASLVKSSLRILRKGVIDLECIPDRASTTNKYKRSRSVGWSVEGSLIPFLPFQQNESMLYITRNIHDDVIKSAFKTQKIRTRLLPSVAYAVGVKKKIHRGMYIGAGIQYSVIKESVDLTGSEENITYTEVQRLVVDSSGSSLVKDIVETSGSGTRNIHALNSYTFIRLPVSLNYTLINRGPWSMQVNGGVMLNLLSRYHNSIEGGPVTVYASGVKASEKRSSLITDVFVGFRLSGSYRGFQLFAEPVLKYNISRYQMNGVINRRQIHQAGLSLGVSRRLGN